MRTNPEFWQALFMGLMLIPLYWKFIITPILKWKKGATDLETKQKIDDAVDRRMGVAKSDISRDTKE